MDTAAYCRRVAKIGDVEGDNDLPFMLEEGVVDVLRRQITRIEAVIRARVPKGGAVARVAR